MTFTLPKPKAKRRWATEQIRSHAATTATKRPQRRGDTALHPLHRAEILDRRSRRRYPWNSMATTVVTSSISWGFTWLFAGTGTTEVPAEPVAATCAGLPLAIGFVMAWKTWKAGEDMRWHGDIAVASLASAGITFWTGMTGPTMWHVLVLFVATVVLGARWWLANPVGPGVESLWTPPPEREPEPEPEGVEEVPETDLYAKLWDRNLGAKGKKFAGSYLTSRQVDTYTTAYQVQLVEGDQNYETLQNNAISVASGLKVGRERLVIEPPARGQSADTARISIITRDPVSETRMWSGPKWNNGKVEGLARYVDGKGEVALKIFGRSGSKRIMVAGDSGGGKSAAANSTTASVMSSGLFSGLVYIDPKGNSSAAMKNHALVSIVGLDACTRAHELVWAIMDGRMEWSKANDCDLLLPRPDFPGLFVVHDEIRLMSKVPGWKDAWASIANTVRSLGLPLLGMNQYLHEAYWGDDSVRSAFAQQVVAFHMSTKSDDLVPGMTYKPRDLPVDAEGEPVPGFAVQLGVSRPNIPALWDWLPSDSDKANNPKLASEFSTSSAFEEFFDTPDLHPVDVASIERLLGPAVDGRWVVGVGGTHQFGQPAKTAGGQSGGERKARGGFGAKKSTDEQCKPRVLATVQGGTTKRSEILAALPQFADKTVDKALSELVADGALVNPGRGVYEAIAQD